MSQMRHAVSSNNVFRWAGNIIQTLTAMDVYRGLEPVVEASEQLVETAAL